MVIGVVIAVQDGGKTRLLDATMPPRAELKSVVEKQAASLVGWNGSSKYVEPATDVVSIDGVIRTKKSAKPWFS
jgi:hypothetical protein